MIVDFQHHYTPPELMERGADDGTVRLDEHGNPNYWFNPLLADLPAHLAMMDRAGIDVAVLSCGTGFDQPDVATCRLINDRLQQAERDHPGRFIGLAHVPALDAHEASAELKRCAVDLGFPGVAIASELGGFTLDAEVLRPFWRAVADLGLYVFIHPLPRVIRWAHMDTDDLGRMLGWQFSLMVATVRLVNSGLLDELPSLRIQVAHFAGGIGRYLPRIQAFPQRHLTESETVLRHMRRPRKPMEYYLQRRLFYDCCGWSGPHDAGQRGARWVQFGLQELSASQVVFATDYPQSVQDADEVIAYINAVRALGAEACSVVDGANAEKLIPRLQERRKACGM